MRAFIGIVPPLDFSNNIAAIQKQYGDNRTEPHITLRPPVHVVDDEHWVNAIKQVVNDTRAFSITLTNTGYFRKNVLFIEAQSPQVFTLETSLTEAVKMYEEQQKKEFVNYHPHLTLGRLHIGFTSEDLQQMQLKIDAMLSSPFVFIAHSVRIYYKPSAAERYRCLQDMYMQQ